MPKRKSCTDVTNTRSSKLIHLNEDQERIIKVQELLDTFDNSQKVASKIVNSYFRSNKFIGSKDR